jgi:protein involved in polysaccharide export with SLBB domain
MRNLDLIGCRRTVGGRSRAIGLGARAASVCAFSALVLMTAPGPGWAADQDTGPGTPGNASYRIGSGDVLNIEVVGRRDLSQQYTVGQDGVLFMPLTGGVNAEGKTATELSAELARRLSLYDRDITQVNVSVAEFRSRKIFVLGAVLHPGKYSFAQLPTVWDAIQEAGGPSEDAQLSAVEIIPSETASGRQSQVVDVAAAIREGRVQRLERLKPGDTVQIPKGLPGSGALSSATGNSVSIFGAITHQGPVPVTRQTDLMSALTQAGGPTADADLSKVKIVRRNGMRSVHMKVNLNDYIDKANPEGNPTLMPGDTVFLARHGSGGFMSAVQIVTPLIALASAIVLLVRR